MIKLLAIAALSVSLMACQAAPVKQDPNQPISIIGLAVCGHWMGAVVVTRDGKVHPSNTVSAEQAKVIADGLPEGSKVVAGAPCTDSSTST